MQKDYRDFTVGELLDLGFNVDVRKHGVSTLEEGTKITRMFEGTKQSTVKILRDTIAKGWKGKFNVSVFIPD